MTSKQALHAFLSGCAMLMGGCDNAVEPVLVEPGQLRTGLPGAEPPAADTTRH